MSTILVLVLACLAGIGTFFLGQYVVRKAVCANFWVQEKKEGEKFFSYVPEEFKRNLISVNYWNRVGLTPNVFSGFSATHLLDSSILLKKDIEVNWYIKELKGQYKLNFYWTRRSWSKGMWGMACFDIVSVVFLAVYFFVV